MSDDEAETVVRWNGLEVTAPRERDDAEEYYAELSRYHESKWDPEATEERKRQLRRYGANERYHGKAYYCGGVDYIREATLYGMAYRNFNNPYGYSRLGTPLECLRLGFAMGNTRSANLAEGGARGGGRGAAPPPAAAAIPDGGGDAGDNGEAGDGAGGGSPPVARGRPRGRPPGRRRGRPPGRARAAAVVAAGRAARGVGRPRGRPRGRAGVARAPRGRGRPRGRPRSRGRGRGRGRGQGGQHAVYDFEGALEIEPGDKETVLGWYREATKFARQQWEKKLSDPDIPMDRETFIRSQIEDYMQAKASEITRFSSAPQAFRKWWQNFDRQTTSKTRLPVE